jgi:hypothetical protein
VGKPASERRKINHFLDVFLSISLYMPPERPLGQRRDVAVRDSSGQHRAKAGGVRFGVRDERIDRGSTRAHRAALGRGVTAHEQPLMWVAVDDPDIQPLLASSAPCW